MRKIVYLLLLVNLGVLTWNLYTGGTTRAVVSTAAPLPPAGDVNQLPLLSELSADALRLRASARRADADSAPGRTQGGPQDAQVRSTETDPAAVAREPQSSPGSDSATAPEPPPQPERADNAPATPAAALDGVAGAGDGIGERAGDGAGDRTGEGTGEGAGGETAALGPQPRNDDLPSRACLTIGPLDADAPLDEISTWLAESGASVDVRTDERREVALFWVYFPPRASRQAALAEVEKLRVEGVTDVIAVPKGDMANAISLGVFSRPESRDRRVREMNDRGYQPSVAPRYRVKLATWVDVSTPAGTFDESAFRGLWPTVGVTAKPCDSGQIAAAPTPSYNAGSSAPRRFHFSGANSAERSGTASASR